jgi:hypothetical protein
MRCSNRSTTDTRQRDSHVAAARTPRASGLAAVAITFAALAVVAGLACSSAAPAAERWTASYVDPPDRVWVAINQTLETLEYEIEEADRHESIIVATAGAEDPATQVTLRIAQVAHTEVVRVHVRPQDDTTDIERFEAAASEFLASLDATMKGAARPNESDGP